MISSYDFEFEATLSDGRLISVVGTGSVMHGCDCDGTELHVHVETIELESVLQLFEAGTLEGDEIRLGTKALREVEAMAECQVLEAAA